MPPGGKPAISRGLLRAALYQEHGDLEWTRIMVGNIPMSTLKWLLKKYDLVVEGQHLRLYFTGQCTGRPRKHHQAA